VHRVEGGENNLFDQSSLNLGEEFGIGGEHNQQPDDGLVRPGTNPAGNYSEAQI